MKLGKMLNRHIFTGGFRFLDPTVHAINDYSIVIFSVFRLYLQ